MTRPPLTLAWMVALLPLPIAAQTPTDSPRPGWCARAATPTERAICADAEVAALDVAMAAAYAARLRGPSPEAVRADQRVWLDLRAACGTDTTCLAEEYRARIAALSD